MGVAFLYLDAACFALLHGLAAEGIGDEDAVVAGVPPIRAEVGGVGDDFGTDTDAVEGSRVVAPLSELAPGGLGGGFAGAAGDEAARGLAERG